MNINKVRLVAEVSANHCQDLNLAKKIILTAKKNKADAVKIQTYNADTMTIKCNKRYFKIKEGLWKGYNLWNLYDAAKTPFEWHKELFNYAKKIKIPIFSTPFDETAVDLLESLKCPVYKVASFEMTDLPLIKKISKTKKPIIISTGMANLKEIEETYYYAKKCGIKDVTLLYCVSKYPAQKEDFNVNNIKILKEKFNCRIGFSDHSKDAEIAKAAIFAGAEIIEKHVACSNQKKGLDINFSIKGNEIKKFKNEINNAFEILGTYSFYRSGSEKSSMIFRRSIFACKNIKKGDKFTKSNIRRIRPGYGLPPKYYNKIIGKKSRRNIKYGDPIKLSDL